MKYQLVLQWPATTIKDYDAIEIEDALVEKLSKANDVDGHDAGSGEMNIFIRTDDPKRAFNEVKAILGSHDFWVDPCCLPRSHRKRIHHPLAERPDGVQNCVAPKPAVWRQTAGEKVSDTFDRVILAHNCWVPEIQDVADHGGFLGLWQQAAKRFYRSAAVRRGGMVVLLRARARPVPA